MDRFEIATGSCDRKLKDKLVKDMNESVTNMGGLDMYITAFKTSTGLFYGVLMVNRPVQGTDRWAVALEDNRGYETHIKACSRFRGALPEEYRDVRIHRNDSTL